MPQFGRKQSNGDFVLTQEEYRQLKETLGGRHLPMSARGPAESACADAGLGSARVGESARGGGPAKSPRFLPFSATPRGENVVVSRADMEALQARLQGTRALPMGAQSQSKVGVQENLVEGALVKTTVSLGDGLCPPAGAIVEVAFKGKLPDGTVFDESPSLRFPLGQGLVIDGWDLALATMARGERAYIAVGPDLAYGAEGAGPIPPDTVILFDLTLAQGLVHARSGAGPELPLAEQHGRGQRCKLLLDV